MESFGGFIRQAREKKRLSLEQVASQTRIQQKYLEALEEEDFGSLPGKVFAKGFVRSYAKALGLNDEDALQRFLDSSGNFYEQTQEEQHHLQAQIQTERKGKLNRNLVLAFFLAIGLGLFYFLPSQQEPSGTDSQPPVSSPAAPIDEFSSPPIQTHIPEPSTVSPQASETKNTAGEAAQARPPSPTPPETATVLVQPEAKPAAPSPKPIQTQPVIPAPNSPQTGDLVLEIEATQLTWVVVRSDDLPPNEALLQPGQRITWKATKQFILTLGNAAGVIIRLNGESQGPFGKPGQVVRDILIKP